jgi:hypothetical protein
MNPVSDASASARSTTRTVAAASWKRPASSPPKPGDDERRAAGDRPQPGRSLLISSAWPPQSNDVGLEVPGTAIVTCAFTADHFRLGDRLGEAIGYVTRVADYCAYRG